MKGNDKYNGLEREKSNWPRLAETERKIIKIKKVSRLAGIWIQQDTSPSALLEILKGPFTWVRPLHSCSPPTVLQIQGNGPICNPLDP